MPETLYHVRSALTGARVVTVTDSDLAQSELVRLNGEARTGIRVAYGEGDDHVPAQRLADGPIVHMGEPMAYEIEEEERLSAEEQQAIAEREQRAIAERAQALDREMGA